MLSQRLRWQALPLQQFFAGSDASAPVNEAAITGFGQRVNTPNLFSTSPLVTGKVYAANYVPPTPSQLTTAVHNMETAYTSAAGEVPPTATELYAGNLGGRTLTPGVYKWSTGVLIPASTALTLDAQGHTNAVWVFQVAGDLTMNTTSHMVLINGARAENVFWQIGGGTGVILNAGAHAEGNILAAKAITMKSGVSLNGRALAQTAVTLIADTITAPANITEIGRPNVTAIAPASGPTTGGTRVMVTGTGFTGATAVMFGATPGTSRIVVSVTRINVTSPAQAAGIVNVKVITPGGTSAIVAGDRFTYAARPNVTAIAPASGPTTGGTRVMVTGTGFTGATAVMFGGTPGTSRIVVSATRINVTSPAQAAGIVNVRVITPGGTSAISTADRFTYMVP